MVDITARIWKAGTNTLVITIPKVIRQTENLKKGDVVQLKVKKLTQ